MACSLVRSVKPILPSALFTPVCLVQSAQSAVVSICSNSASSSLWSLSSFLQFGLFLPPVWAFHTTVFSNRISFIFVQLDFCHTCRDICFTFTFLLSSCMRLPSSRLGLPFLSFGSFFSHLWDISENESQLQKYNANNCWNWRHSTLFRPRHAICRDQHHYGC